jgi:hypothetical protein
MAIDYQGLVTQGLAKQISEKIREAILEGRVRVHERLPTEEELAAKFNVSRPTIHTVRPEPAGCVSPHRLPIIWVQPALHQV